MKPDTVNALTPWNGNVVRSRLFDGISLLLPAAEAFLIATVEQWLSKNGASLTPAMRAEVERFIREERAHQQVHSRYNETLIATTPAAREAAERASRVTDELTGLDLKTKMALAAAFEHLTSVLSREMLEWPYLLPGPVTTQHRMWRWHAREELSHSHVVMDAAALLGVGHAKRLLTYGLATAYLLLDVLRYWSALCRCDRAAGTRRRALWAQGCLFVAGGIPSMARMAVGWAAYAVRRTPRHWRYAGQPPSI